MQTMITITEWDIIMSALNDRENRMFRDYTAYQKTGNKPAMMDCLREMKAAATLRKKIEDEFAKERKTSLTE